VEQEENTGQVEKLEALADLEEVAVAAAELELVVKATQEVLDVTLEEAEQEALLAAVQEVQDYLLVLQEVVLTELGVAQVLEEQQARGTLDQGVQGLKEAEDLVLSLLDINSKIRR